MRMQLRVSTQMGRAYHCIHAPANGLSLQVTHSFLSRSFLKASKCVLSPNSRRYSYAAYLGKAGSKKPKQA
jgi:hypothetical protein